MTSFLTWGADWLNEMSDEHTSVSVVCSWRDNNAIWSKTVLADLVDEEGHIIRSDVKARIENTQFMFNTSAITENAIPLMRGLRITWEGSVYEVVLQGGKSFFYNDAFMRKVVVVTKHVSD